MLKMNTKGCICITALMMSILVQPALTTLHAEETVVKNSIERKKALRNLTSMMRTSDSAEVPAWMEDLLESALEDPNPTVVAEAADQIGNLKIRSLNNRLIDLYGEADVRFGGYGELVKNSIIEAVGKNKGAEAAEFLSDRLMEELWTPTGYTILMAIKNLNDSELKDVLQRYAEKMEDYSLELKQKGEDPLFYSNFERYGALAREIADSLGGSDEN